MIIKSLTCTLPKSQTRPMSLRARSTSMTCSARSLGSASNSFSSALSSSGVCPRRLRAGDGPDFDAAVFATHMNFRRRADQRETLQFEQEHVRRRIDRARRAVNIHRRSLHRRGKSLRADHLDDVARRNVFFCARHIFKERLPGHVGGERDFRHVARDIDRQMFQGLFEQGEEAVDFRPSPPRKPRRGSWPSRTALTRMVMVCATRSNTSNSSAIRK